MNDKDNFRKEYDKFQKFLCEAVSKELECFILDSKFTSAFNYEVKKVINSVKNKQNEEAEFSVLFNTKGEAVLIDAAILGRFISNNYVILMDKYYKGILLNKLIKDVRCSSEKVKRDFIKISYSVLYKITNELYKEIKCKKELKNTYLKKYKLEEYKGTDASLIVVVLLILEDVCEYMNLDKNLLISSVNEIIFSKNK